MTCGSRGPPRPSPVREEVEVIPGCPVLLRGKPLDELGLLRLTVTSNRTCRYLELRIRFMDVVRGIHRVKLDGLPEARRAICRLADRGWREWGSLEEVLASLEEAGVPRWEVEELSRRLEVQAMPWLERVKVPCSAVDSVVPPMTERLKPAATIGGVAVFADPARMVVGIWNRRGAVWRGRVFHFGGRCHREATLHEFKEAVERMVREGALSEDDGRLLVEHAAKGVEHLAGLLASIGGLRKAF